MDTYQNTHKVLVVNSGGVPIVWEIGDKTIFRGGFNRLLGRDSSLETAPIISIKGENKYVRYRTPLINNRDLFARDLHTCAYCGFSYGEHSLSRDHIIPLSKGGTDTWMNVVTSCISCNNYKGNDSLDKVGMELLYLPYIPNKAEHLILRGRNILPEQAEYLRGFVSENSKALKNLETYCV
jgi:5-methylcytosine-specific restriction endonuclease McrA